MLYGNMDFCLPTPVLYKISTKAIQMVNTGQWSCNVRQVTKTNVGYWSLFTRDDGEARIQKNNKSEQNNTMMNGIQNEQHQNNT